MRDGVENFKRSPLKILPPNSLMFQKNINTLIKNKKILTQNMIKYIIRGGLMKTSEMVQVDI